MTGKTTSIHARPEPPARLGDLDGVIVVDKPSGPTSHDIVDAIRSHFRIKKVGHGGTLDPQATGVLVVLLGRGTKLSSVFMASDKTYEGVMRLGAETDSQDADGVVIREADCSGVSRAQVETALDRATGDIWQTPPMVSAKKVNGVPLYKLARKGKTVEREPKLVHVYEFTMRSFALPDVAFTVRCTRGTYVRTLCADIGETLGCGAHLAALRRTASGALTADQANPLETLLTWSADDLKARIIPLQQFAGKLRR